MLSSLARSRDLFDNARQGATRDFYEAHTSSRAQPGRDRPVGMAAVVDSNDFAEKALNRSERTGMYSIRALIQKKSGPLVGR